MSSMLLFPLHGAFLIITFALFLIKLIALVDACIRPERAYVAAGKQTKVFWVVVLVLALVIPFSFLSLVGLVAALVYLLDVRPRLREIAS